MKNNKWISSCEESPRLPRPNALLLSWMEMERNQKCLSLALERNNSVRWNTNRPSLPPADEPWLHKHTRVVWIWLSHIMEKWIMNIPPETDVQTQRIPDVLISLLYKSEETLAGVSIHAAPLRFDRFENMRNYKHQFIANGKKCENLQFCTIPLT